MVFLVETRKALLVCLLFTLFYLGFSSFLFLEFGTPNNGSDFDNHWNAINGKLIENYPSGYHSLFHYFNENKELFFAVNVVLICFVLPMLLFKFTKTWWVTITYFLATGLAHQWLSNATFPQALVFILIAVYLLNRKNWLILLLCGLLAGAIHRQGLMIFIAILAAELFEILINKIKNKELLPGVAVLQGSTLSLKMLPCIFLLQLTLPLLILGRKIIKDYFLLFLAAVGLLMCFFDLRTISLTQFVLIIVAAQGLKDSPHKKTWVPILLIYGTWLILIFVVETTRTIVLNT
jgi:hypothetical protein